MIRLALALWLALGGAVSAQDIAVRSGEHDGFARIVLTLPPGTDWRLGRSAQGYDLKIDPAAAFDTSQVFARIDRNRLSDLSDGGGILHLVLGCECYATAFPWQSDGLVIDIRDGPAPEGARFEAPLAATGAAVTLPLLTAGAAPGLSARQWMPDTFVAAAGSPAVGPMEMELLQTLSRAAAQGLIDPAHGPASVTGSDQANPQGALAGPEELASPAPAGALAGLWSRTGLAGSTGLPLLPSQGATGCLPASYFELPPATDFNLDIAAARTGLTGEFDRMAADNVLLLARTYLNYGFGAEAAQALGLDGTGTQEKQALLAMARLIDGRPASGGIMTGQGACEGDGALWAFLAGEAPEGEGGKERILAAYRRLPVPAAKSIAPELIARLLATGDSERADMVSSLLAAGPDHLATVFREGDSLLAQTRGETALALQDLSALAASDPRLSPDGLARLFDLTISEGGAVLPADLRLSESLRYEYRDDPGIARLTVAETRARAAAGDFAGAFGIVSLPSAGLDGPELGALRDEIAGRLASDGSDESVMAVAFDLRPDLGGGAQNLLAGRLLDMGFADRAAELLSGPAGSGDMAERRYLRAAAALARGHPEDVALILHAMNDPRAEDLRARAGRQGASAMGERAGLPEIHGEALAAGPGPPGPSAASPPIAASRELLDGAEALRLSIAQMLSSAAPESQASN